MRGKGGGRVEKEMRMNVWEGREEEGVRGREVEGVRRKEGERGKREGRRKG